MNLDVTVRTRFDEVGQDAPWRNEVAQELNILLGRAQDEYNKGEADPAYPYDHKYVMATIFTAQRVAEFESINLAK